MKAPTYILKNVYQESLIDSQYQKHVAKMIDINQKGNSIQVEEHQQMEKILYSRLQKERTRRFIQQQSQLNRQLSDNFLIKKMMKNDQRQVSIPKLSKKSLIATAQKQQAYEIGQENFKLGKRIIASVPTIKKKDLDKEYLKHESHKINASRMRTQIKSRQNTSSQASKKEILSVFTEIPIQFKLVVFNKDIKQIQNKDIKLEDYVYSVEVILNGKQIIRTMPVTYEWLQTLNFKVPLSQHQYQQFEENPFQLKLWKIKHNTEIYMGQIYFGNQDQQTEKDLMKKVGDKEIWNGFIQL